MLSDKHKLFCQALVRHGSKSKAVVDAGLGKPMVDPTSIANELLNNTEIEAYRDALASGIDAELLEALPAPVEGEVVTPAITAQKLKDAASAGFSDAQTPREELDWIKNQAVAAKDYKTVMQCIEALRRLGGDDLPGEDVTRSDVARMTADELREFVIQYAPIVRAQRAQGEARSEPAQSDIVKH